MKGRIKKERREQNNRLTTISKFISYLHIIINLVSHSIYGRLLTQGNGTP